MNEKTIIDHTADSLRSSLVALGMPSYSASQVIRWVYGKGAVSFDEMSDISKKNISLLKGALPSREVSLYAVDTFGRRY